MEPIWIGICDDEADDGERVAAMLKTILSGLLPDSVSFETRIFQDGNELCKSCMEQPFSLVFADIEMPVENGLTLACRLMEYSPSTDIVFVTNHQNYIFDTQELEPLWFVRKEELEKDLRRSIQKYIRKNSYKWVNYKLEDGFGKRNIMLQRIYYFEGSGHEVTAAADSGKYRMYGSLEKIGKELSVHGFIRIHRNFLVNCNHISHVIGDELELYGGLRLPLGRRYKKEVLERMHQHAWRSE